MQAGGLAGASLTHTPVTLQAGWLQHWLFATHTEAADLGARTKDTAAKLLREVALQVVKAAHLTCPRVHIVRRRFPAGTHRAQ